MSRFLSVFELCRGHFVVEIHGGTGPSCAGPVVALHLLTSELESVAWWEVGSGTFGGQAFVATA